MVSGINKHSTTCSPPYGQSHHVSRRCTYLSAPQAYLLVGSAVFALYFPTSIDGHISEGLASFAVLSVFACLTVAVLKPIILWQETHFNTLMGLNSAMIILILFIATANSPFKTISWGAFPVYFSIALIYLINLKMVSSKPFLPLFLVFINFINLAWAIGLIFQLDSFIHLTTQYYTCWYDELLEYMLVLHKPILVYGSHSVAAFFFYIFFLLNIETYTYKHNRLYLVFSILYILLQPLLLSSSAYVFFVIAILHFTYKSVFRRFDIPSFAMLVLLAISLIVFLMQLVGGDLTSQVAKLSIDVLLGNDENGFLSRYATGGALAPEIRYILANPLFPVGLTYSEGFLFGDSGAVVYVLRGGVLLLLAIYGGLLFFLKTNLESTAMAYWLFFIIAFFEIGFTPLTYFRFIAFLPFVIVYLNSIRSKTEPST